MLPSAEDPGAGTELCALLGELKQACGLTYDDLAAAAPMARNTVLNYITKPGHRRDTRTLEKLLTALHAAGPDRQRALELHRRTQPTRVDSADVGWVARVRAAGCVAWPMGEFTAVRATVHTAIGRRRLADRDQALAADLTLPAYVPRAHDSAVREHIRQAAAGGLRALIVLRGTSSTGKTRSLFEAVHALCPGWAVIRPLDAAAARRLPTSGLLDRPPLPVVVWLNELQGFLGPNGTGLSTHVLEDLYTTASGPVVLVGTLWPDKLRDATDPRDETRLDTRELLAEATQWVRWHDVAPTLTTDDERTAARELATTDPRLAAAVADPDRFGFAQTLAGAHELLEHYRTAPTMAGLLLDAAADARRLGHTSALSAELLRAVTLASWRAQHGRARPPDPGWFTAVLAYATQPLRADDGVRALIPLDIDTDTAARDDDQPGDGELGANAFADAGAEPAGYGLADYLEQHLTRTRGLTPVSDGIWDALRIRARQPADLKRLARAADNRGRYRQVEALYRAAGAAGDAEARRELAEWLRRQPGREPDVEQAWRDAAAAGDPYAPRELALWLSRREGRKPDIEQAWRDAAAAGDPDGPRALAQWLSRQPGREPDVEQAWRRRRRGRRPAGVARAGRMAQRAARAGGRRRAGLAGRRRGRGPAGVARAGRMARRAAGTGGRRRAGLAGRRRGRGPAGVARAGQVARRAAGTGGRRRAGLAGRRRGRGPAGVARAGRMAQRTAGTGGRRRAGLAGRRRGRRPARVARAGQVAQRTAGTGGRRRAGLAARRRGRRPRRAGRAGRMAQRTAGTGGRRRAGLAARRRGRRPRRAGRAGRMAECTAGTGGRRRAGLAARRRGRRPARAGRAGRMAECTAGTGGRRRAGLAARRRGRRPARVALAGRVAVPAAGAEARRRAGLAGRRRGRRPAGEARAGRVAEPATGAEARRRAGLAGRRRGRRPGRAGRAGRVAEGTAGAGGRGRAGLAGRRRGRRPARVARAGQVAVPAGGTGA